MTSEDRCIVCGDVVPEGRQVCPACESDPLKKNGGKHMTAKQISAWLVVALAVIAAVTAIGFIAGYAMQPMIVLYWSVLTAKNLVDYIGLKGEKHEG